MFSESAVRVENMRLANLTAAIHTAAQGSTKDVKKFTGKLEPPKPAKGREELLKMMKGKQF